MPIFENIWDFKKNENKRMEYKQKNFKYFRIIIIIDVCL